MIDPAAQVDAQRNGDPPLNNRSQPWRRFFRGLAALGFVLAGANHFVDPAFYVDIIPPGFPDPPLLVAISGLAEIAGGLGLLLPRLRRAAGWGLIALLVAVFPANVYMLIAPKPIHGWLAPTWLLWARLPLQGVFVAWIVWVSLGERQTANIDAAANLDD